MISCSDVRSGVSHNEPAFESRSSQLAGFHMILMNHNQILKGLKIHKLKDLNIIYLTNSNSDNLFTIIN